MACQYRYTSLWIVAEPTRVGRVSGFATRLAASSGDSWIKRQIVGTVQWIG